MKKAGGEGGNLPPPPEPPVIEGQELSTPPPPHDPKVTPAFWHSPRISSQFGSSRACDVVPLVPIFGGRVEGLHPQSIYIRDLIDNTGGRSVSHHRTRTVGSDSIELILREESRGVRS